MTYNDDDISKILKNSRYTNKIAFNITKKTNLFMKKLVKIYLKAKLLVGFKVKWSLVQEHQAIDLFQQTPEIQK